MKIEKAAKKNSLLMDTQKEHKFLLLHGQIFKKTTPKKKFKRIDLLFFLTRKRI